MTRKLIINADDMGYTAGVNRAILQCFMEGSLSSATLPARGQAFEEAVEVCKDTLEKQGKKWELVLVNDGSTDDTARIPDSSYERDPRLAVGLLLRYMTRPLHFFGKLFLLCSGSSFLMGMFLLFRKVFSGVHIFQEHGPLALLAAVLMLAGVQFLAIGLLGEILARVYFESQDKKIYTIRRVRRREA